jgi:hypothetical protein
MQRLNFAAIHRKAAKNLEDSLRHYEEAPNKLAKEFVELKLQACIFQYDVCAEMLGFLRNKPTRFAAVVALKGLVLRLYEYDNLVNTTFIPRLLALAEARGVPFDKAAVKQARAQWKNELNRLKRWSDVRNQAAGHYGKDLARQVALLKQLDPEEVMTVTKAFLSFNMSLLVGLRDAGREVASDA